MERMRDEIGEMVESHNELDTFVDQMAEKYNHTTDDVYNLQSWMKRLQVAFNKQKAMREERGRTLQSREEFDMVVDVPDNSGPASTHDPVFTPAPQQLLQVPSTSTLSAPPLPALVPSPLTTPDVFTPNPHSSPSGTNIPDATTAAAATSAPGPEPSCTLDAAVAHSLPPQTVDVATHTLPPQTLDAATAVHSPAPSRTEQSPGPVLNLIPPTPQASQEEAQVTTLAITSHSPSVRPSISITDPPVAGPSRLAASGPMTRSRSQSSTPVSASSSTSYSSKRKARDQGEAPETKRKK